MITFRYLIQKDPFKQIASGFHEPENCDEAGVFEEKQLIINIITLFSISLLIWGVFFEFARLYGFAFNDLFIVAIAVACLLAAGVVFIVIKHITSYPDDRIRIVFRLLLFIILSVGFAWLRSRDFAAGADALDYQATPFHYLNHPDKQLGFKDYPFFQISNDNVISGYWLPYTFEYLLAAWSCIFRLSFIDVCYRWLPFFGTILSFFSIFGLIRIFGTKFWTGLILSISTIIFAFLDGASFATWGAMGIMRLYENKGLIYSFAVPSVLFLSIESLRSRQNGPIVKLFLLTSAFVFFSQNAIYILPIAGSIVIVSHYLAGYRRTKTTMRHYIKALISIGIGPAIMFFLISLFGGPSIYDFLDAEKFGIRLDQFRYLSYQIERSFSGYGLTTWLGLLCCISALMMKRNQKARFLLWMAIFQLILIVNYPGFAIMKFLGINEIRVFWRFFIVLPIILFIHLSVACLSISADWKYLTGLLGLLLVGLSLFSQGEESWAVKVMEPRRLEVFRRGHFPLAQYTDLMIDLKDRLVLAPKADALRLPLFTPSVRPLAGSSYFLAWRAVVSGKEKIARDIIRAQLYLDGRREEKYLRALKRVISEYDVAGVWVKSNLVEKQGKILLRMGYSKGPKSEYWQLFVREQVKQ